MAKTKAKAEAKEQERLRNELVGAVALKEFEANPSGAFAATLRNLMGAGVTNTAVRAELGLPPLPKRAKVAALPPALPAPAPEPSRQPVPVLIEDFHPPAPPASPIASALRGLADRAGFGSVLPKTTK